MFAGTVVQGPVSLSRDPGDWAEFSCTVACSHTMDWYVEGYSGDITDTCSMTLDGMMVCKEVTQACTSTSSPTGYTETLRVLAKPELASTNIAVQCAAVSLSPPTPNNCPPFLAYSRYALLSGKTSVMPVPTNVIILFNLVRPLPTEPPTTPSPSPTPVVCPTAVQGE